MQENADTQNNEAIIKEMLENGVQYGRAKRFTNPKLREFLIKSNKIVEIFDVSKTLKNLDALCGIMSQLLNDGKNILFVGTQPAASEQTEKIAKVLNQFYLTHKWIGGFLTNFTTIKSRIKFYKDLKERQESGEIDTYSPIEKSRALRELQKMENIYIGVKDIEKIPDAIFVINIDYKPHKTMQREAKRMNIPVIGICGSDNDPDKFKVFAPMNDKAPRSIKWSINYIINKLNPDALMQSEAPHPAETEIEEIDTTSMPVDADENISGEIIVQEDTNG